MKKTQQRFIYWPYNVRKLGCVAIIIPYDTPVTWIRDWWAPQRDFLRHIPHIRMSIHNCLVPRLNLFWHCNDINIQGQSRSCYCHCLPFAQALHQEVFVLLLSCIPPSGLSIHQFYTPVHRKRRIKVPLHLSVDSSILPKKILICVPFSRLRWRLGRWYGFWWERRRGRLVVANRV